MLFCLNPKANPRLEKNSNNVYFLNSVFISLFSILLVIHSYLELFTNHDQWMRLIFDTVNDVSGFEGYNAASMKARTGQNQDNKIAPQVNFNSTAANILDMLCIFVY